eukprot:Seg1193.3 transcript_id=Seg1193.3/GoldUCD/mRNA.D3Y31 product="hypothetical protein" protein_id=Seg1193.3/GoldUCD/D3Y31
MGKSWKIKLDDSYFADPNALLTENGLKVTFKADIKYYFVRVGDFKLEISVSDGVIEKIIERDICVRYLNKKVKLSVQQASTPGRPVSFSLMTTDPSLGMCHIHFGNGRKYNSSTNIKDQLFVINSTYDHIGVYQYTWSVRNSTNLARGTGQITILYPVMEPGHYSFPKSVEKSWPDNRVKFYLMSKCRTDFYLLLEDFGAGTELIWDFRDNKTVIRQKIDKFSPANSLRDISRIRGTESLNLTRYMGYVRQHTYSSKGMYDVSLTANDQFTSLVAKRTVFFSGRTCKRPEVTILPKDQKFLQFSLRETFTVPSNVKLECDDFNEAAFKWRRYASSKEAMDNHRIAESDKIIRLDTRNLFIA